jgi:RNA polymerase sigma factor (TIGR02999 family)
MSKSRSLAETLQAASKGDPAAAADLLPLVYAQLRQLAQARMERLPPGNTLDATALVHEAYLRVVGDEDPGWNSRGHFFAAAAESMRQILVDQARRKNRVRHGGGKKRTSIDLIDVPFTSSPEETVALDEAIERLRADDARKAQIVTLRCFAGLNRSETAAVVGASVATIDREWRYIVARMRRELDQEPAHGSGQHD